MQQKARVVWAPKWHHVSEMQRKKKGIEYDCFASYRLLELL